MKFDDCTYEFFQLVREATGDQRGKDGHDYYLELIKNWGGGTSRRSSVLAEAVYYYLHKDEHGSKIACDIDVIIFGETYLEKFGDYVPGGIKYKPPQKSKSKKIDSPQPKLSPPRRSSQSFHFASATMNVLGRDRQQKALNRFTRSGPGFQWMQLAGDGGQGKSRLALELVRELDKDSWSRGFLYQESMRLFEDKWSDWKPGKPHLMVVDYVVGQEAQVGKMMGMLADRTNEFEVPVLVLLLERQHWNRGGISRKRHSPTSGKPPFFQSSRRAEWFDAVQQMSSNDLGHKRYRFESGAIELLPLKPSELVEIVRCVAKKLPSSMTDQYIARCLKRVDNSGRPLFAYFLAEALSNGAFEDGWSQEDLLDEALAKDQFRRWKHAFQHGLSASEINRKRWHLPRDHPAKKLAVLATMIGHVDCDHLVNELDRQPISESTMHEAKVLTGTPTETPVVDFLPIISGLEPDILGEWFVIKSLSYKPWVDQLISDAWLIAPQDTASLILRLTQDFPHRIEIEHILEIEPSTEIAKQSYTSIVTDIFAYLIRTDQSVPDHIVEAVQERAETNDSKAMNLVGLSYYHGRKHEQNYGKAFLWFRKAAKAGNEEAIFNLGSCYASGQGVKLDRKKGLAHFRNAAASSHGAAMHSIGVCYVMGYGVEEDFAEGNKWFRRAVDAGYSDSMYNLGVSYERGHGVEQDYGAAASWFRKAADSGDIRAIYNLGVFHLEGKVPKPSLAKAVSLFRKAAKAGYDLAMFNLGRCYEKGHGLRQSDQKAISWYRKAAKSGNTDAMCNLGLLLGKDDASLQNTKEAANWFKGASKAGNSMAMYCLGICYENGLGVEKDADKASYWREKATQSGFNPNS